jgi:hypothetical protein
VPQAQGIFRVSCLQIFSNMLCGNQMGTKFWKVVCDEHSIGGSCVYCGENDAHLARINVLYHEALGGKYAPSPPHFISRVLPASRLFLQHTLR